MQNTSGFHCFLLDAEIRLQLSKENLDNRIGGRKQDFCHGWGEQL